MCASPGYAQPSENTSQNGKREGQNQFAMRQCVRSWRLCRNGISLMLASRDRWGNGAIKFGSSIKNKAASDPVIGHSHTPLWGV